MGVNVESRSNKRNGLVARVCGEFLFNVIKLIERKRESRFFTLTMRGRTAYAESLVFPLPLQNRPNILTLGLFPLKSSTYAFQHPNKMV